MPRQKRLSMKKVEQQVKNYNKTSTYHFQDGETLVYYPLFSPSNLESLLNEFIDDIAIFAKEGIDIDAEYEHKYLAFLIVKYFTHLGKDISDERNIKIQQANNLIDSDYFAEMMEDMFDQNEIYKVQEMFTKKLALLQYSTQIDKNIKDYVSKLDLRNKDVMDKAFNKIEKNANEKRLGDEDEVAH